MYPVRKLKNHGCCLKTEDDLWNLAAEIVTAKSSFPAAPLPAGIGTREKPILESLPHETRFLVIHKKFVINGELVGTMTMKNLCIIVTCIRNGGQSLPEFHVLVRASAVHAWVHCGRTKYENVISSLEEEMFSLVPAPTSINAITEIAV